MKKKVALFGCGWSYDYVVSFMRGIEHAAKKHGVDIYMFLNYASYDLSERDLIAEKSIFKLPDLTKFDGAIILGNILNFYNENVYLQEEVSRTHIPALYVEYEHESIPSLKTNNVNGMQELVEHLFTCHHIKHPIFISGPADHQESNLRLKIFQETCQRFGCEITNDQILVGNWTEQLSQQLMKDYIDSGKPMPDAVICANDNTAFGVYTAVQDAGYSVPDDVIITGYDAIEDGIYVTPILTSVGSNSEDLGEKAIELILEQIHGDTIPKETVLPAKLEIRQSCGCLYEPAPDLKMKIQRSSLHHQRMNQIVDDSYFRNMYGCIREVTNIHWLHYSLKYFYVNKEPNEGKDIMVCLNPDFVSEKLENLDALSDHPDVVYAYYQGSTHYHFNYDLFNKLEELSNMKDEAQLYLFVPLHTGNVLLGYSIFHWKPELLHNYYIYIWSRHMEQGLDLVRHNMKIHALNEELKSLSYTDPLTGVFNRIGCEDLAAKLIEESTKNHFHCAVIMADLDSMKTINDNFGHTQGDLALRLLSEVMTQCCPDDYIISRYGGDEFLITGACDSMDTMHALIKHIEEELTAKAKQARLPYDLTASIGGFLKNASEDLSLEECIENADHVMYQVKEQHHNRS